MVFWTGSFAVDLLFGVAILIFSVLTYSYYSYLHWARKRVPYLVPSFPFGNIKKTILLKQHFGFNIAEKYNEFKKLGAKYGGFYMFWKPSLVFVHPDIIKQILTTDFQYFLDRSLYHNEEIDPLSIHLFAVTGNRWRKLRKKISPTFTSGKMKNMFYIVLECAQELEHSLEVTTKTSEPVNIKETFARYAIDVIGSCVFGLECNSLKNPNSEFYKYGNLFVTSTLADIVKSLIGVTMPGLLKFFKIPSTNPAVTKFFMGMLKETIEHREKHNIQRNDFVDLFIKLKNNENITEEGEEEIAATSNQTVSFNELAAQAFVFLVAGFESTSTTLSLCLYELSMNSEIQNKLRDEILATIKMHDGKLTYEGVTQMQYLDQCVSETLRKYPVAPFIGRISTMDYKLPNTDSVVAKGTPVWISVLGLHRDPEYYPNPDKFDPDRFKKDETSKRNLFVYLPFGEGPRQCIGMRFGLMKAKVALAVLLKNYIFSVDTKTKIPVEFSNAGILLTLKQDLWLQAVKVTDC